MLPPDVVRLILDQFSDPKYMRCWKRLVSVCSYWRQYVYSNFPIPAKVLTFALQRKNRTQAQLLLRNEHIMVVDCHIEAAMSAGAPFYEDLCQSFVERGAMVPLNLQWFFLWPDLKTVALRYWPDQPKSGLGSCKSESKRKRLPPEEIIGLHMEHDLMQLILDDGITLDNALNIALSKISVPCARAVFNAWTPPHRVFKGSALGLDVLTKNMRHLYLVMTSCGRGDQHLGYSKFAVQELMRLQMEEVRNCLFYLFQFAMRLRLENLYSIFWPLVKHTVYGVGLRVVMPQLNEEDEKSKYYSSYRCRPDEVSL